MKITKTKTGKYTAVVGEMMGMSLTGEDINDIAIELQSGGQPLYYYLIAVEYGTNQTVSRQ